MIRRGFTPTSAGVLHHASVGDEDLVPIVLLHQAPRSWAEFRSVLPLLGQQHHVIAVDIPGFGDSTPPRVGPTIEVLARLTLEGLEAMGLTSVHLVGHHTGGVVAMEMAIQAGTMVESLVLSSTPYTGAEFRRRRVDSEPIDQVEVAPDGSHLMALWQRRQSFYPPDRPDLLQAFVLDALRVDDPELGHRMVASYHMEDTIGLLKHRTCVIRASEDSFAFPHAQELLDRIPASVLVEIAGGMVPLPDQMPDRFAAAIEAFVAGGRAGAWPGPDN